MYIYTHIGDGIHLNTLELQEKKTGTGELLYCRQI